MTDAVEVMARAIHNANPGVHEPWANIVAAETLGNRLAQRTAEMRRAEARAAIRALHEAGGLVVARMPGYTRTKGACANGYNAALAALRAAGYVVERDWQDISTAPRDGTRIQCYAPAVDDRAAVGRVDYWWVRERGFAHMRPIQPYTHWRPLPAPPGAAT